MNYHKPVKTAGFTLIEMSVVLVIIGLIVAAIISGQDMIRTARINNIITDFNHYKSVVSGFDTKYEALPGDMIDATDFWSGAVGNGDGDGLIEANTESALFFVHLKQAGFIEGSFDGVFGGSGTVIGTNAPYTDITGATFWPMDVDELQYFQKGYRGSGTCATLDCVNILSFGKEVSASWPFNPVFTPREAHIMDLKMDDGLAGEGEILAGPERGLSGCSTGGTTPAIGTDNYDFTNKDLECVIGLVLP